MAFFPLSLVAMKQFDRSAQQTALITLLISLFLVFVLLWHFNGQIGTTEVIILVMTMLSEIAILFLVKRYANKRS